MPSTGAKKATELRSFLKKFGDLLDALPRSADKQTISASIETLGDFLRDVRNNIECIPSSEDVSELRRACQTLADALHRAEKDPMLAAVFGIRRPVAERPLKKLTASDTDRGKVMLHELEQLPTDEMRTRLEDTKQVPIDDLRALAHVLGLKLNTKLSREAMTHQITSRISNYRGYAHLRDRSGTDRATD